MFSFFAQEKDNSAKCKALCIDAAQFGKDAYEFSKEIYFMDDVKSGGFYLDSVVYFARQSIVCLDSAILLASDSDFVAVGFARFAKKNALETIAAVRGFKETKSKNNKRLYVSDANDEASHLVIDAYHASFYFDDGKNKEEEKKPEPPVTPPAEKKITKLDVDQALFALLNEQLTEKSGKVHKEIESLDAKIKASKDPAKKKKMEEEERKLEEREKELVKKNVETSEKLTKINTLIEERDKKGITPANSEETVFSKGISKPIAEWGLHVIPSEKLPDGLIYQVQIGVYKNEIVPEIFKGLTPMYSKHENGGTSYSTGVFEKLSDAQEAKVYVRSMGLNDAFVIAYHNHKKISLAEAAKLEKK